MALVLGVKHGQEITLTTPDGTKTTIIFKRVGNKQKTNRLVIEAPKSVAINRTKR